MKNHPMRFKIFKPYLTGLSRWNCDHQQVLVTRRGSGSVLGVMETQLLFQEVRPAHCVCRHATECFVTAFIPAASAALAAVAALSRCGLRPPYPDFDLFC